MGSGTSKVLRATLKGKYKLILSMISRRRAELVVFLGTEDASRLRPQPPQAPRWGRILAGSLLQPTELLPDNPNAKITGMMYAVLRPIDSTRTRTFTHSGTSFWPVGALWRACYD